MYRLMKSEPLKPGKASGRSQAFEQQEVAGFEDLSLALVACEKANRAGSVRHYLMSPSGKELYGGYWID